MLNTHIAIWAALDRMPCREASADGWRQPTRSLCSRPWRWTSTTKKQRRIAEFDWVQFRKSALLNGPTNTALTFVDYLGVKNQNAYRLDQLTQPALRFIEEIERVAGVPVFLVSTDFEWRNVIHRRAW